MYIPCKTTWNLENGSVLIVLQRFHTSEKQLRAITLWHCYIYQRKSCETAGVRYMLEIEVILVTWNVLYWLIQELPNHESTKPLDLRWWTSDETLSLAYMPSLANYIPPVPSDRYVLSKYLSTAVTRFLEQSNRATTIELGSIASFCTECTPFSRKINIKNYITI